LNYKKIKKTLTCSRKAEAERRKVIEQKINSLALSNREIMKSDKKKNSPLRNKKEQKQQRNNLMELFKKEMCSVSMK